MTVNLEITRIGDFALAWGESLLWDDLANRLYFVDCSTGKLYWLNNAEPPLYALILPSMPTGLGLTDDARLIAVLDEGLHLIDPDSGVIELLVDYPAMLGKRANDATVDAMGNLITGSLNEPNTGSYWRYSIPDGWSMLDSGISNANGPVASCGATTDRLVFADTPAQKIYAYDYDPSAGVASEKREFGNTSRLGGFPDGACLTSGGDILSCIYGAGLIAHYSDSGLQQTFAAGSEQPSDITFGGPNLDRMFVTSISVEFGHGKPASPLAGALVEIKNTGFTGVKEKRFRIGR